MNPLNAVVMLFTMTPEKKLKKLLNEAQHNLIDAEDNASKSNAQAAQARETINRCKAQLGLLEAPEKLPGQTAPSGIVGKPLGATLPQYPVREGHAREFIGSMAKP